MPVFVRIQTEAFHLARQIWSQRLRRQPYPSGDDRLHTDAILPVFLRQSFGQAANLRLSGLPHGTGCLCDYSIQKIFRSIIPIHRSHDIR